MKLRTAHIILISAAIFLGAVLIIYGLAQFTRHDDASGLVLAGAGGGVGVGLVFYLRAFMAKTDSP